MLTPFSSKSKKTREDGGDIIAPIKAPSVNSYRRAHVPKFKTNPYAEFSLEQF